MQNENDNKNLLDSSIGHILTVLFFECKDCHHIFSRLENGIVHRLSGNHVVSTRDKSDRTFKPGKCEICGSKAKYNMEFL